MSVHIHFSTVKLRAAIGERKWNALTRIVIPILIAISIGAFTGLSLVRIPSLAWIIAGTAVGGVLLLSPSWIRITAAILAAVCSRLLVATGLVSSLVNFFHFPLVLGIALLSAIEGSSHSPLRHPLEIGLLGLLAVSVVSWVANGGEILRPLLDWLVFCEPLLLTYAIINREREARTDSFLWFLFLFIAFGQIPFAIVQTLVLGPGDTVQGFFVGLSAGAHVVGGVALLGTLYSTARAFASDSTVRRLSWLMGGGALFLVCILADAKQAIIAFFPAILMLMGSSYRVRWSRAAIVILVLAAIVVAGFLFYTPLQLVLNQQVVGSGIQGKFQSFRIISEKLSENWSRWIIGVGPGNSISRVAQMGLDVYVKSSSPVFLLGLGPAATTLEIYSMTASSLLFSRSSAFSGISSFLGLLGDLGVAGVALFMGVYWWMWRELGKTGNWHARVARCALLMMILLGFLYNWWEEPGFTSVVALLLGLGLTSKPHEGERASRAVEREKENLP